MTEREQNEFLAAWLEKHDETRDWQFEEGEVESRNAEFGIDWDGERPFTTSLDSIALVTALLTEGQCEKYVVNLWFRATALPGDEHILVKMDKLDAQNRTAALCEVLKNGG